MSMNYVYLVINFGYYGPDWVNVMAFPTRDQAEVYLYNHRSETDSEGQPIKWAIETVQFWEDYNV